MQMWLGACEEGKVCLFFQISLLLLFTVFHLSIQRVTKCNFSQVCFGTQLNKSAYESKKGTEAEELEGSHV